MPLWRGQGNILRFILETWQDSFYTTLHFPPNLTLFFSRWEWTSSSSDYYLDPVVLRLSESSLCRGYHENRLIPGSTDHTGRCAVGFFGRVYKLDKYQVRIDISIITQPFAEKCDEFSRSERKTLMTRLMTH